MLIVGHPQADIEIPTACRLGFHHWTVEEDDEGERSFACPRCGRVDADNDTHIAAYAMAFGFGGRHPLPQWWRTPTRRGRTSR